MSELPDRPDRRSPVAFDERWSFGGATTTVATAGGDLLPGVLVVGPRRAAMDAWWRPGPDAADLASHRLARFEDITAVDDRGAGYALRVTVMASSGAARDRPWPVSMSLSLDPVPGRETAWIELRDRAGTAARLLHSARTATRVGPLTPAAASMGQREQPQLAHSPEMLATAGRQDRPSLHLDLAAALPVIDGVTVQPDVLFSVANIWWLHLRAMPGWWKYSDDRKRKRATISVSAEDDRGGSYVSIFGGSTGCEDHEELALRFQPPLDPLARVLNLTLRGATEEVRVIIDLGV